MGLLVAGSRSTGTSGKVSKKTYKFRFANVFLLASWLLIFLGTHPVWRERVAAEFKQLLAFCGNFASSEGSLSSRVAAVPLEAWERETPVFDAVLAETLRLAQPHVAMRRNLGPDVQVGEHIIPTGAYVVYPFADIHLNPELYPDPSKFDPSRNPPQKSSLSYVGWGAGTFLYGFYTLDQDDDPYTRQSRLRRPTSCPTEIKAPYCTFRPWLRIRSGR